MAIERYIIIAADRPNPDTRRIRLDSTHSDRPAIIDLAQRLKLFPRSHWGNYPLDVVAGFMARGLNPGGFDALIYSTVPLGWSFHYEENTILFPKDYRDFCTAGSFTPSRRRRSTRRLP